MTIPVASPPSGASTLGDASIGEGEMPSGGLMPGAELAGYKPSKELPKDAVEYSSGDGISFYAPPDADFNQVYAYGQALRSLPPGADGTAIAIGAYHGGIFDYQRSDGVLYTQY